MVLGRTIGTTIGTTLTTLGTTRNYTTAGNASLDLCFSLIEMNTCRR